MSLLWLRGNCNDKFATCYFDKYDTCYFFPIMSMHVPLMEYPSNRCALQQHTQSLRWFVEACHSRQATSNKGISHEFLSDTSEWSDQCFYKENPKVPDIKHQSAKEVLLDSSWANEDTEAMIEGQQQFDNVVDNAALVGHDNRSAGLNQEQSSIRHPNGCDGSLSTISVSFESGCEVPCAVMRAMCKKGQLKEAIYILDSMDQQGMKANFITYVCILQGCINKKSLIEGKWVHAHILKCGIKPNIFLQNTLLNMYSKCGSVSDARQVFDKMIKRNVFTWNIMIAGYANHGHAEEATNVFWKMEQEGVKPNEVTFVNIIKACIILGDLEHAKQVHAYIIRSGFDSNAFVGSALVDMYAKCGSIGSAQSVFNKLPKRDVVSWTAMISGYTQHGHPKEALALFWQMEREGVKPNQVTFVSILKACTRLAALEQGKQFHAHIIRSGFESYVFVGSSLVDMYAKCGSIEHARSVFNKMHKRDVVAWTAMIAGYVEHGNAQEALTLFCEMGRENIKPNEVTFVSILKACSSLASLKQGQQIHACIIESGFESNVFVGSSLIAMYAKCGSIEYAHRVFDKMPEKDVVLWTAIIAGHAEHGNVKQALQLFWQMDREGMKPDKVAIMSILRACASVAALDQGKLIHAYIIQSRFELDVSIESTLVDMYAKCGSIQHARRVFDNMRNRDVVSWNAIAAGYAQQGQAKETLQLVEQMRLDGMKLNHTTFTCILSACSHAGLVDQGRKYFESMNRDHAIAPTAEHYACMVDLLGRAGHLEEAEELIKEMPFQPTTVVWTALLAACRIHGNVELAERATDFILKLEPQNVAAFVLLSNIYAAAGRWDDKAKMRKLMEDLSEKGSISYIEVNSSAHELL